MTVAQAQRVIKRRRTAELRSKKHIEIGFNALTKNYSFAVVIAAEFQMSAQSAAELFD